MNPLRLAAGGQGAWWPGGSAAGGCGPHPVPALTGTGEDAPHPEATLEFLWYDTDRPLLWVDHFWCGRSDLEGIYAAMLRRLGYKTIKWVIADKSVAGGGKSGKDEVYLAALLQKPTS